MLTVNTSITGGVLRVLARDDTEFDEVARSVGLDPRTLRDPDARVPYDRHVAIWGEITRRRSDPYVGLKAAGEIQVDQLGVVARSIFGRATLEEASQQRIGIVGRWRSE
jgi:hypothetical protein